jgi:hypothetical protein
VYEALDNSPELCLGDVPPEGQIQKMDGNDILCSPIAIHSSAFCKGYHAIKNTSTSFGSLESLLMNRGNNAAMAI